MKASEKAFMFLLASSFPAGLLRYLCPADQKNGHCCLVVGGDSNYKELSWMMNIPYKVEPKIKAGLFSGRMMNCNPIQRSSMAFFGASLHADGLYG